MEWSSGAEKALNDYCQHVRGDLGAAGYDGADPDEVAEDIRHHVNADLHVAGVTVVTREHVERALERIGRPIALAGNEAASSAAAPQAAVAQTAGTRPAGPQTTDLSRKGTATPPWETPGPIGRVALTIFGVLLPLATLLIELGSGMCATEFFNPIPTIWHVVAIALVPFANAVALYALGASPPNLDRRVGVLNAAAIAISGYYAVLFLPMLPIAVVGLLFGGLGLLPLSPFLAFIITLRIRWRIWKATPWKPSESSETSDPTEPDPVPGLILGLALGIAFLTAINAPSSLTNLGLHMANSRQTSQAERGIKLLRTFGSEAELLKRCYAQPRSATGMVALVMDISDPVPTSAARETYYRVTGRPFNASPPPGETRLDSWLVSPAPFIGGDDERGGDRVGARSRGLELASSRLDAQISADEAFAYTEWTMSFRNRSALESLEARMLLALPPDGVVSRLTLWVNGEEREAAFAGRSDVRRAYEDVVRTQRDPVLVTTAGRDRVLVQCFPVLPDGGTMKIRVGITAPLGLTGTDGSATRGHLRLPSFVERNFAVGDLEHSVWIESSKSLDPGDLELLAQEPAEGRFLVRGHVSDTVLSDSSSLVRVDRDPQVDQVWTPVAGREAVEQTIRTEPIRTAKRIILVVDGSKGMADHASELAEAMDALPTGMEFTLMFASELVETPIPLAVATPETPEAVRLLLEGFDYTGGRDAVPALRAALDLAIGHDGARVLWIHGAQPVGLKPTDALMQYADRCGEQRALYSIQIAPGPNVIARELAAQGALLNPPRNAGWSADIADLLATWGAGGKRFVIDREPLPLAEGRRGAPASLHVARLWAADEVQRLTKIRSASSRAEAVALAVEHQLVTEVTGAVVLENEAQYQRAGLDAVDAATVPILPEPEFVLIVLLAVLVALGSFLSRRRRTQDVPA